MSYRYDMVVYDEDKESMTQLEGPIDNEVSIDFLTEFAECLELFDVKQTDYGPLNILKGGEVGVSVRMTDKIERLKALLLSSKSPKNEAIEDTYRDIANYAIIGLLLRKGKWPGVETDTTHQ